MKIQKNKWAIKMRSLLSELNKYRKKLKEKGIEKNRARKNRKIHKKI